MISLMFSGTLEKCKVITWNLYLEQCASICQCHSVPVIVSVLLLLLGSLWKLLKLSPSGLVRKEHSNDRVTPALTCKKKTAAFSIRIWMEEKSMDIWGVLLQLLGPKYWEENIFRCASISWIHVADSVAPSIMFLSPVGICWAYLGHILGISWAYHGLILGISRACHGHILSISRAYHGHILGISWPHIGLNCCSMKSLICLVGIFPFCYCTRRAGAGGVVKNHPVYSRCARLSQFLELYGSFLG